jgi:hypothetical protein
MSGKRTRARWAFPSLLDAVLAAKEGDVSGRFLAGPKHEAKRDLGLVSCGSTPKEADASVDGVASQHRRQP